MRQSATFPAGDTNFLKRKLVSWAGNFSCAVIIDHNQFSHPSADPDYLVAADSLDTVTFTPGKIFDSIAAFHDLHKDWLFGYLTYDVKNETEPGVLFDNPYHIDGIQFPIAHFFRPKHLIRIAKDLLTIESVESPDSVYASILSTDFSTAVVAKSANLKLRMQKEDYFSRIGKLQQHIVDGDVYEVNFCQEFYAESYTKTYCKNSNFAV
jgi:para-aminobenzoate synthetase component 1